MCQLNLKRYNHMFFSWCEYKKVYFTAEAILMQFSKISEQIKVM